MSRNNRRATAARGLIGLVFIFALTPTTSAFADPHVPSAEIVGLPVNTGCTGGDYAVPTQYNMPEITRVVGSLVVDGVGQVSGYDQEVSRTDLGSYNFAGAVFNVPSGTRLTATLTTYYPPADSVRSYVSELVFECGTGTLISLDNDIDPDGARIPVLSELGIGVMIVLLAGAAFVVIRRHA